GVLTGLDRTVLQALAVGRYEARLELVAARRLQEGGEIPVFFRDEALDLRFPVADEAQRDRLDAPGRARARQLAPEDRGEIEADQIVEGAAGQIGVHQPRVDVARIGHGV